MEHQQNDTDTGNPSTQSKLVMEASRWHLAAANGHTTGWSHCYSYA